MSDERRDETESHEHGEDGDGHGHIHGVASPALVTTARGIWAVKWSFVALAATAAVQLVVVIFSGSVALLADTIHNFGDAFTAVPLWIAFVLARRTASSRFTYGLGRVEDLAGAVIVLLILASAVTAAYQSVDRLLHPQEIRFLWVVALAGGIGFIGNEAVAVFRIKVGREINSAALVADGYHARVDGLTSLAVLASALAAWAGFPLADPLVGLLISLAILKILWDSAKTVFTRMLDGVDPKITGEIIHGAEHVGGVIGVSHARARWLGHQLDAELHVTVAPDTSVQDAHRVTVEINHRLKHRFPYLRNAVIHVDPADQAGLEHHRVAPHAHDGLPVHSHS
jgi:cation diffusion facilitator family transporter